MRVVPLGDHVVVKPLAAAEVTSGGIVLPDAAREKPREGKVLSVGDGRRLKSGVLVASQVSEGDRVLYSTYAGSEIEVDGETVLVLSEQEILAVLE